MIKSVSSSILFSLMDEYSSSHRPFLFAIDYECEEAYFVENPLQTDELEFSVHGVGNATALSDPNVAYEFVSFPESPESYKKRFEVINKAELHGNSFLANLTVRTPVHCTLTLGEIYKYAKAPFKLHIPQRFVCYSPEPFIHISQEGRIASFPMKGTIDATLPDAAETLRNDYKERSEHYTIVDLIRNDLSRVAKHVRVDRFAYMDRIVTTDSEILQMSSEISGQLEQGQLQSLGSVLKELLPAGSISGAPKEATCAAIREAETGKRGFYSGVFGYYDGKELDSAVMIRFIEQSDPSMSEAEAARKSTRDIPMFQFRSGGGITIHSDCKSEYDEVIQKVYLPF